jgi:hypothetical protein
MALLAWANASRRCGKNEKNGLANRQAVCNIWLPVPGKSGHWSEVISMS